MCLNFTQRWLRGASNSFHTLKAHPVSSRWLAQLSIGAQRNPENCRDHCGFLISPKAFIISGLYWGSKNHLSLSSTWFQKDGAGVPFLSVQRVPTSLQMLDINRKWKRKFCFSESPPVLSPGVDEMLRLGLTQHFLGAQPCSLWSLSSCYCLYFMDGETRAHRG